MPVIYMHTSASEREYSPKCLCLLPQFYFDQMFIKKKYNKEPIWEKIVRRYRKFLVWFFFFFANVFKLESL